MTTGMRVLPMTEGATEETLQDVVVAVTALQSDLATLAGIDYATEATATGIAADLVTLNATATGIATQTTLQALANTATGLASEITLGNIATGVAGITTRLNEMGAGLVTAKHDSIYPTFNATSDVWEYKSSGTTVATVTVNYVDSTKAVITSIVRT